MTRAPLSQANLIHFPEANSCPMLTAHPPSPLRRCIGFRVLAENSLSTRAKHCSSEPSQSRRPRALYLGLEVIHSFSKHQLIAYCMQVGMLVTGNSDVKAPHKGHPRHPPLRWAGSDKACGTGRVLVQGGWRAAAFLEQGIC